MYTVEDNNENSSLRQEIRSPTCIYIYIYIYVYKYMYFPHDLNLQQQ
jgi:hypothetical protein